MQRTTFPTAPDLRGLNPYDAEAALRELQRMVRAGQVRVTRRPFRARGERLRWNIYWRQRGSASRNDLDLNRWARAWLADQYTNSIDADLDDGDADSG